MSVGKPANEQETIIYFSQILPRIGFEILHFWSRFPDARILDIENNIQYDVEFEYKLSSFIKHGHNPFKCDFVICWADDVPDFPLPVWELSKELYPAIFTPDLNKVQKFHEMIQDKKKKRLTPISHSESSFIDWSNIMRKKS